MPAPAQLFLRQFVCLDLVGLSSSPQGIQEALWSNQYNPISKGYKCFLRIYLNMAVCAYSGYSFARMRFIEARDDPGLREPCPEAHARAVNVL
jgi:hypothetical protein